MRFNHIALQNFRAWENLDIPIRPITFVFGPNNSGKSAILSAFALLAQTVESADRDVPLLLERGPYVDLGTFGEVVYGNNRGHTITIRLGIEIETDDKVPKSVKEHSPFMLETTFKYRVGRRQIVLSRSELSDTHNGELRTIFKTHYLMKNDQQLIESILPKMNANRARPIRQSTTTTHFLVNPRYAITQSRLPREFIDAVFYIERVQSVFSTALQSLEYLSAFREKPGRIHRFGGQSPSSVGSLGELTTDVLVADYYQRGRDKADLIPRVSQWMKRAKLANAIKLVPLTDRHFEIRAEHPVTKETQNLADVGSGLSQVLHVLVAGYWADPLSTVIIEEPEMHLHPQAQAEVGQFVYEMYQDKVQTIIETHSEHLLLRIQRLVSGGLIPPDDVAIFYVYPNMQKKDISRIRLGDDGFFQDEWPEGFFPERLIEARGILKNQARRT